MGGRLDGHLARKARGAEDSRLTLTLTLAPTLAPTLTLSCT